MCNGDTFFIVGVVFAHLGLLACFFAFRNLAECRDDLARAKRLLADCNNLRLKWHKMVVDANQYHQDMAKTLKLITGKKDDDDKK